MPISTRDYSSSEDEETTHSRSPKSPKSPKRSLVGAGHKRRRSTGGASVVSGPSHSPVSKAREGQRVKLTLRPSSNHLNTSEGGPSKRRTASHSAATAAEAKRDASPRSSLSPPPPITLKLGLHRRSSASAAATTAAERAVYSSSEDEAPAVSTKKSKGKAQASGSSVSKSPKSLVGKKKRPGIHLKVSDEPSLPAQHRKSYDWLRPSAAGASHRGPPVRNEKDKIKGEPGATSGSGRRHSDAEMQRRSSTGTGDFGDGEDVEMLDEAELEDVDDDDLQSEDIKPEDLLDSRSGMDGAAPNKAKRSHKKRLTEGPGKAWRRGLKKGMAVPWIEGGTFMPNGSILVAGGEPGSTGNATPMSAGSPEPISVPRDSESRAASPPFVLADRDTLDFPLFSKPIVPPRINLTNFPRVTTFFNANNGGDVGPFPRKEKVRSWTMSERTFVGIGGGRLKYKGWNSGPPTELADRVRADREAKEQQRKEAKAASSAAAAATATATATATANASARNSVPPTDTPVPEVQQTQTAPQSTESTPAPSISEAVPAPPTPTSAAPTPTAEGQGGPGPKATEEEASSEVGDGDESVVSATAGPAAGSVAPPPPTAAAKAKTGPGVKASGGRKSLGSRGGPGAKAKLKKSKLAQEITAAEDTPSASTSAIEDLM